MWKIFDSQAKSTTSTISDDSLTEVLIKMSALFRKFLLDYSFYVYFLVSFLIMFCTFYYILACKRQMELKRRRQELQRASERVPKKRLSGTTYRDHEISENYFKTMHRYIEPKDMEGVKVRPYTLKRTRSGTVYGSFTDN